MIRVVLVSVFVRLRVSLIVQVQDIPDIFNYESRVSSHTFFAFISLNSILCYKRTKKNCSKLFPHFIFLPFSFSFGSQKKKTVTNQMRSVNGPNYSEPWKCVFLYEWKKLREMLFWTLFLFFKGIGPFNSIFYDKEKKMKLCSGKLGHFSEINLLRFQDTFESFFFKETNF